MIKLRIKEWLAIGQRLAFEMWMPLLIALGYSIWSARSDRVVDFLAVFGPTFFLSSWLAGQINRVAKQRRTENSLTLLIARADEMMESLERKTNRIASATTGGNGFAVADIMYPHSASPQWIFHLEEGDFPIREVHARIYNLADRVNPHPTLSELQSREQGIAVGTLTPGMASFAPEWKAPRLENSANFNIFFTALNGSWTEELRIRKVGDKWLSAVRISNRDHTARPVELMSKIPDDFPEPEIFLKEKWSENIILRT